ncbi:MAG: ABC transporter permease [Acidimicrobiales bacterium]
MIDAVPAPVRRVAHVLLPAACVIGLQLVAFPVPLGVFVRGATVGLLTALVALGAALVYRANRALNFATADLGYPSALVAVMLVSINGLPYLLGLGGGLLLAFVLGAVVELLIVRRFATSSRLIFTVATIGLAQLLASLAYSASRWWWDDNPASLRLSTPIDVTVRIHPLVFDGDDVVVWVVSPVLLFVVWWLLARTRLGALVRAAADRGERAALLGVPVRRVHTLVWALASMLAFVALWLRAGVLGLPVGAALGLGVLLRAVGALVVGRMTELVTVVTTAVAFGVLETAVTFGADSAVQGQAVVAGTVLAVLLLRRRSATRAELEETSSWRQASEVRPVPSAMRRLPEVRITRWVSGVLCAAVLLALPFGLSTAQSIKATSVLAFGVVGVSLVVLTGWAGQVSLGQMAFVAWGGAVTAASTDAWGVDPLVAFALAAGTGGLVACAVGLPALRFRGLYLAVTTLAFGLVTSSYLLDPSHFDWVSTDRFERRPLLGRIDLESDTAMYFVSVGALVLVGAVLRRLAMRENEAMAQSFGISPVRTKLTAFALSGAVAAFGGALLAYQQHAFVPNLHAPETSIAVFVSTVIGGLGAWWGGSVGALFSKGLGWFLPEEWLLLTTSMGMLAILLVLPDGLGGALVAVRDRWLRAIARDRGMHVPSLLADRAEPAAAGSLGDGEVAA